MAETVERKFGARMPLDGFTRETAERHVRGSVVRRARQAYPDLTVELADVDVREVPANTERGPCLEATLTIRVQLPPTGTVARG